MADFNQKKPGEKLSDISSKEREKLMTRNVYKNESGYNANHPNAISDGDPKGKGNAQYLNVYNDGNTGGSLDILGNGEPNTGRIGNVKTNLYNKSNEYSAGNLDSGDGYSPTVSEPR
jgi:hypothetical protein|tara:strand:+ start:159 stop:509 length:351 start_codon:yes stop_codon:yes gene_type:complete